ncbi:hypothetical protein [Paludisphaera rhizosphaerae]|uniref:hypothetical protein n=1 Tax=Paludisphaera rhizosphaerae TaxID=2711216 RepID=UPI0013EA72D3|nr:hypothetical protein [Paludisphaera rhizosphaerae]
MGRRTCCCTVCTRTWTVLGCSNYPLPDAVVTMTSSGGIVSTGTTGADGTVVIPHGASSGSWSVSHPSGRFFTNSGTFTACTGATTQTVNLFAATGYRCCNLFGSGVANPYPVATTLTLTDGGGSMSVALAATCDFSVCSLRPNADNYAASCDVVADRLCYDSVSGTNVQLYKPPTIGTGSIQVTYTMANTASGWQLTQAYYWCVGTCYWEGDSCPTPTVSTKNKARYWRVPIACGSGSSAGGALLKSHVSTGYTINSLNPPNVTFHFASGNGFGPFDVIPGPVCTPTPTPTGNPYSSDVTIAA